MMRTLLACTLLTAAAGVAAVVQDPTAVSAVVVLTFVAVVPGALLCQLLRLPARGALAYCASIGTGFAGAALMSTALLSAQVWTPARTILGLCIMSGILIVATVVREARHRTPPAPVAT